MNDQPHQFPWQTIATTISLLFSTLAIAQIWIPRQSHQFVRSYWGVMAALWLLMMLAMHLHGRQARALGADDERSAPNY
jgi:hypothetical protein